MGIGRNLGILGSIIGAIAIFFDVYYLGIGIDNMLLVNGTRDIAIINAILWILWFTLQGAGFLGIYSDTDAISGIGVFVIGLLTAFLQFMFYAILLAEGTVDLGTIIALAIFFIPLFFASIGIQVVYMILAGATLISSRDHFINSGLSGAAGVLCIISAFIIWAPLWSLGVIVVNIILAYTFYAQELGSRQMPELVTIEPPAPEEDGSTW
jgi:hypothetical protein